LRAAAARDHVVDHSLQAKPLAVVRRIDLFDSVVFQRDDFVGYDHPAATAEHLDALTASRSQQIDQVAEVFVMAALVARHRDAVRIFLQRGGRDFIDGTVMA
jgi:hypothetical protein